MKTLITILLIAGTASTQFLTPVSAEDSAPVSAGQSPLQELIDESIGWFDLTAGPIELTPTPVLRWDNNARGSASGLTVLYIGNDRPEAVCCIYPWEGRLVHEFDSLSSGPLRGQENGEVFWRPDDPGVTFRPIPNGPTPNGRRGVRLRQIKQLAERFSATLIGWLAGDSDRQALRLLPRPIYRYEPSPNNVLDGAVFAFVMGVDPETLLLIEAVENDDGGHWQYAFVRRSSGELSGSLDGETVWSAGRFPETHDPESTHRSVTRVLEQAQSGKESAQHSPDPAP